MSVSIFISVDHVSQCVTLNSTTEVYGSYVAIRCVKQQ